MPISLLWAPCGLNKLLEACFELPFNLTGKMTMAFLTGQSWCMLKSRDTVGGPERGFQICFAGRHNPKLSFICGTGHPRRNPDSTSGGGGQFPPLSYLSRHLSAFQSYLLPSMISPSSSNFLENTSLGSPLQWHHCCMSLELYHKNATSRAHGSLISEL